MIKDSERMDDIECRKDGCMKWIVEKISQVELKFQFQDT